MNKKQIKKFEQYFSWQAKIRQSSSGSLKFSKRIIEPLRHTFYSALTMLIAKAPIQQKKCDILFLHASEKSKALKLRQPLISELKKKGFIVLEDAQQRSSTILKNGLLTQYKYKVPFKYLFIASYMQNIVDTYRPKIIITDRNGSIYSPFLKEAIQVYGKLVHIAHSVTTDNFGRFSLIEYDYYFLFGTSSLNKLLQRQVRYGSTKAVLTGPYFSDKEFTLPPTDKTKNILLFGIGPDLEKHTDYGSMYYIIKDWIAENPEYTLYFKPHPRSRFDYWQKESHKHQNIVVLKGTEKLTHCFKNISIALSIFTNAVIDAALLNRPSLLVCSDNVRDELDVEAFYLPRSKTSRQLHKNITTILDNYQHYVEQSQKFARFHLEHQQDSIEYIANCLASITNKQEDFPYIKIEEKMDNLKLSIIAD